MQIDGQHISMGFHTSSRVHDEDCAGAEGLDLKRWYGDGHETCDPGSQRPFP